MNLSCNQEIQMKATVSYPYTPTTQAQAAKSVLLIYHKGGGLGSRQGGPLIPHCQFW